MLGNTTQALNKQGIVQLSDTIFYDTYSKLFVVAISNVTVHVSIGEFFELAKDIKQASVSAESVVMLSSILENNVNRVKSTE
jgi:hypothetical protein